MSQPPWRVRIAKPGDAKRLQRFKCAPGSERWHTEVEAFIQTDLFDWGAAPRAAPNDPRVLLLVLRSTLVGVAAHEKNTLGAGDITFIARRLHVLALATKWHGKKFADGNRASDVLMTAALTDIANRDGDETRVFAVVHRENQPALKVCAKHGLVQEMSPTDTDYKWLLTD